MLSDPLPNALSAFRLKSDSRKQQRPQLRITAFRNVAVLIDRFGLKPSWHRAEVGVNGFGSLKAIRVIDRCHISNCSDRSSFWNGHQAAPNSVHSEQLPSPACGIGDICSIAFVRAVACSRSWI